jgi:hypothetical protein
LLAVELLRLENEEKMVHRAELNAEKVFGQHRRLFTLAASTKEDRLALASKIQNSVGKVSAE